MAHARSELRNRTIIAFAVTPRPTTSPMAMPTDPFGKMNTSYQSPPTPPRRAGRYRAASSRPGTTGNSSGRKLF